MALLTEVTRQQSPDY